MIKKAIETVNICNYFAKCLPNEVNSKKTKRMGFGKYEVFFQVNDY